MNAPADNSTLICRIPLSLSTTVNLTISRDMSPEDLEERLNDQPLIQDVGGVRVLKEYYDGDYFMTENLLDVKFTIIFLTRPDVGMSDIPLLSLRSDSDVLVCDHTPSDNNATSEEYTITVSVDTVQSLSYPSDFRVGFVPLTQPPRHTPLLPLNVTADQLSDEISPLFAWECESDVDMLTQQGRVKFHSDFEEIEDDTTSFCGHYSKHNPRNVWRSSRDNDDIPINPNQYRYVS